MYSGKKLSGRLAWLALAGLLPALYLCQIMPHGHEPTSHDRPHEVPPAHAQHAHHHSSEEESNPPESSHHHHHDLADHLDSHVYRSPNRELDADNGQPLLVVQISPIPLLYMRCERPPDPRDQTSDPPALPTFGPRAPPLAA